MSVAIEVPAETNNDYRGPPINVQIPPPFVQPGMQYPYQGIQPMNPEMPLVHLREPYAYIAPQYVHPGAPYASYVHTREPYAQASNLEVRIANPSMMNVPQGTRIFP